MTDPVEKHFVRQFLNFVQKQTDERSFSADTVSSLEIAKQCLETAFELPTNTPISKTDGSVESHAMVTVDLFEMFQNSSTDEKIIPERKLEAEKWKIKGNDLMMDKKYREALTAYNRAITLDASSAIFYCNRAAAYCRLRNYQRALVDCKMSLKYDPKYSKAYSWLGHAHAHLNQHQLALEAYQNAMNLDPDNMVYQANTTIARERLEETIATDANATVSLILRWTAFYESAILLSDTLRDAEYLIRRVLQHMDPIDVQPLALHSGAQEFHREILDLENVFEGVSEEELHQIAFLTMVGMVHSPPSPASS